MPRSLQHALSRRERQVMDGLFQHGPSTVSDVLARLPDPPSYSAVRALLRTLEEKGYVRHQQEGPRYLYVPVVGRASASRSALRHLVRTFFDGSGESLVAAVLQDKDTRLAPAELDRLAALIDDARRKGAKP